MGGAEKNPDSEIENGPSLSPQSGRWTRARRARIKRCGESFLRRGRGPRSGRRPAPNNDDSTITKGRNGNDTRRVAATAGAAGAEGEVQGDRGASAVRQDDAGSHGADRGG